MNPLKPVRFYGNALPRPRYYEGRSKGREPLLPVNDSLLRWAADANWSMGGLSFKKQRMQGKIEGRLRKLKDDSEDDVPFPHTRASNRRAASTRVLPDPEFESTCGDADDGVKTQFPKQTSSTKRSRHFRIGDSQMTSAKKLASLCPPVGQWGEEYGPNMSQTSLRARGSNSSKKGGISPPSEVARPVSVDASVRRRQVERALPDHEDSDSDVNWEEFTRRKQPLRTTRATKTRRSIKEFEPLESEEHTE